MTNGRGLPAAGVAPSAHSGIAAGFAPRAIREGGGAGVFGARVDSGKISPEVASGSAGIRLIGATGTDFGGGSASSFTGAGPPRP